MVSTGVALQIALLGAVLLIGVGLAALGLRELLFAVRIYRSEPTTVAEAANTAGTVELQGVAEPDEGTVEAPFSGAETLICEWEVQEERTRHSNQTASTYWQTLDEGLLGGPFRLRDDTASCRVEPAGSVRHLGRESVEIPAGTELPDRIRRFVATNPEVEPQDGEIDLGVATLHTGNDQRYVERRLDPGEDCYVYGAAHYDPTAGSRAGEVNVVVDGDGARRFLIADSRERGVAWSVAKPGLAGVVVGALILAVVALFL